MNSYYKDVYAIHEWLLSADINMTINNTSHYHENYKHQDMINPTVRYDVATMVQNSLYFRSETFEAAQLSGRFCHLLSCILSATRIIIHVSADSTIWPASKRLGKNAIPIYLQCNSTMSQNSNAFEKRVLFIRFINKRTIMVLYHSPEFCLFFFPLSSSYLQLVQDGWWQHSPSILQAYLPYETQLSSYECPKSVW